MSFILLFIRSFAPKKCRNCTQCYFGMFIGWLDSPTTLITHCWDLEMLFTIASCSTYVVTSSSCSDSTCLFMELVPKKGVLCNDSHLPFCLRLLNQSKRTMWGKQMLHFIFCTWSQVGDSHCLQWKKPRE